MNRQQRKGHVRVPIQTSGRPNILGPDKKIINFAVPNKQAREASRKSRKGQAFNVADFMRLLHKHLFVEQSLAKAQALHRQLITLDERGGKIEDVGQWLADATARNGEP